VSVHYSADFYANDEGWWEAVCNCGANLGVFPDAETACDALMQHAYEEGRLSAPEPADPAEKAE
jgi:hypothetical protein